MSNLGFLASFFARRQARARARREAGPIYRHIMAASRRRAFFTELDVPDTPEGRFELLTLHLWLALRILQQAREPGDETGRALLEAHFAGLDADLREAGAGDMAVAPRMRRLARTFYSRLPALDAALGDKAELAQLLSRTLYAAHSPGPQALARMTGWLLASIEAAPRAQTADEPPIRFAFPEP